MSYRDVRGLLGRPDARSINKGKHELWYDLGPERDSFFQIDSEGLSIRFDRADIVRSVGIYQS